MSLGRCVDCGAPYDRCEEALDSGEYTTDANGNHDGLCCEGCQHLAEQQNPTPSPSRSPTMSFLSAFQSIVAKLKAEGHSLAGEAEGLFGEAEKIVAGLAGELAPAFDEIKTQLTADGVKLSAEALAEAPPTSSPSSTPSRPPSRRSSARPPPSRLRRPPDLCSLAPPSRQRPGGR
jgi:hypothetical protein